MVVAVSILVAFTTLFFFELRRENQDGKGFIISLFAAFLSFFVLLLPTVFFFILLLIGNHYYPQAIPSGGFNDLLSVALAVAAGLHLSEITIEKIVESRVKKGQGLSFLYIYRMVLAWVLLLFFSNFFFHLRWDFNGMMVIGGLYSIIGYVMHCLSKTEEDVMSQNM
jgi:hypothetical protein